MELLLVALTVIFLGSLLVLVALVLRRRDNARHEEALAKRIARVSVGVALGAMQGDGCSPPPMK